MKNFIIRVATGIVFVGLTVGCILWSPLSFGILFAIYSALTVFEFGHLINESGEAFMNRTVSAVGAAYLFMAFMVYCTDTGKASVFLPYLLLIIYLLVSELYLKKESPLGNWAYAMFSQVYIALPFALLNVMSFQNDIAEGAVAYNPIAPLSIFIFLWLNDSGAYLSGMAFGRHKLFERISPHKTWEGSIGGGLLTVAASLLLAYLFPVMTVWQWIGLALTVVVFGTWGDLTESLLKRQLGIKDSGHILPGHGGMLDRFDSALIAIPAATIYLYLLIYL